MVELLDNPTSTDVPSSQTPKSPSSSSPNPIRRSASPMQDEEKRKILKMLISPSSERKPSKDINDFMMIANQTIKAAKSAENLSTNNQVCDCICSFRNSILQFEVLRQESTLSLQVPMPGLGQRKVTFSQVEKTNNFLVNNLTFQVVDQLACSLSDSSSLSDVSCGEDFKLSVSGSNVTRRSRKPYRPSRWGRKHLIGLN